jgi:hypothetical protein
MESYEEEKARLMGMSWINRLWFMRTYIQNGTGANPLRARYGLDERDRRVHGLAKTT